MTASEELEFQTDPVTLALELLRANLPDEPEMPLAERLDFIADLADTRSPATAGLASWMQRALQD